MPPSPEPFKPYSLGNIMTCEPNMVSFFPLVNEHVMFPPKSKGCFYCYDFIMLLYGAVCFREVKGSTDVETSNI